MERVLGSDLLARARQHNRFEHRISVTGASVGRTIRSIEVRLLDRYQDER